MLIANKTVATLLIRIS